MKFRILRRAGTIFVACSGLLSAAGESSNIASEVRALFAVGAWDQAVNILEQAPNALTDPSTRELLAMAYLYTSSRLDSTENLGKAATLTRQIIESGGKAHFFVSEGRDKNKDNHLVEAIPGELTVTGSYVEFQAQDGSASQTQRWDKKDITECAPNPKYGKSSNSFHLIVGRNELDFRPLHFSAEESNLICSLIGAAQPPAAQRKR
jgi:hypothetical protein